eukprot:100636-Chlamydomonas_euryale.AAC.3
MCPHQNVARVRHRLQVAASAQFRAEPAECALAMFPLSLLTLSHLPPLAELAASARIRAEPISGCAG